MARLTGKVALITGAAQGMGASHARRFVKEGAFVLMTDVKAEQGLALAEELGSAARFVRHNVTLAADWDRAITEAEGAFGPVNVLVNNAGIGPCAASIVDMEEADYRRCIDINQVSVFLGMKAIVPSMTRAGGGSIVNISSAGGIVAFPNGMEYIASKFAVRGMTKAAAVELADRNIRANSVHPGTIRTPMHPTELEPYFLPLIPLNRVAEPEEVTNMVVFLASDESAYCTGSEFIIDGGMIAK